MSDDIQVGDYVTIKSDAMRKVEGYVNQKFYDIFCALRETQAVGVVTSIHEGLIRVNFPTHFGYFKPEAHELKLHQR
jgi:hypothetical protein